MHEKRKSEHLDICRTMDVRSRVSSGLSRFVLAHTALPGLALEAVDLSTSFLGKSLQAPLLISAMTGGAPETARVNRNLAMAAQELGLAMGVGSQRAGIDSPSLMPTYVVRDIAPDIALYANVGAVQLRYGYGTAECHRAVDSIEADALVLHFNPLQEALQPEGNTRFDDLLPAVESVCRDLSVPVIAKEVGWGLSADDAQKLVDAGVAALDVAGAGGTSWSRVEALRGNARQRRIAEAFDDWGIPTGQALSDIVQRLPDAPIVASGGLCNGVEAAKCLALGASLAGYAGALLDAACKSAEAVLDELVVIREQLRVALFCTGSASIADLGPDKIKLRSMQ